MNLLFLRGFIVGISIAAPVGPIGVLCIRRTLSNGRASGFISGLGAATADGVYGLVAAMGLTVISNILIEQQLWLRLIGGVFLVILGFKTLLEKPKDSFLNLETSPSTEPTLNYSRARLFADYISTFLLTLTNPLTILSFAGIFAGLGLAEQSIGSRGGLWLVVGVFLGSGLWWFVLSGIASSLKSKFLTPQGLLVVSRISGLVILGFGIVALSSIVPGLLPGSSGNQVQVTPVLQTIETDIDDFARADGPWDWSFPDDHGPHPDFQTEWWYFTGNVQSAGGRQFGYQLTFFRRALIPSNEFQKRPSAWATNQAYMAHFALSDINMERFRSFERLSRGAAGLAGSQAAPFEVWLEDWQVQQIDPKSYQLTASQEDITLDVTLTDLKGPVLQGNRGYSQKGVGSGQASYYYSLTRLLTKGDVLIGGENFDVEGLSWMDHEFSTRALSQEQVGWDWFSIQLDDGKELMVFQIRRADGTIDPFSSGTIVFEDGSTIELSRDDFEIQVQRTWTSPDNGASYPAQWLVSVPSIELVLTIEPQMPDQELLLTYQYWEGAVIVDGSLRGLPVGGKGYVELTGYAGSMGGEF